MQTSGSRRQRSARIAGIALLLAPPLLIVWNLAVLPIDPSLGIRIGRQLAGVIETPPPVRLSWSSLTKGSLQELAGIAVAEAYPLRPLLIRINHEIRFTLFGYISVPSLFQGDHGQLVGMADLAEYCSRGTDPSPEVRAREAIPKLKDIQAYYRARNRSFFYLISPSKPAYMPEKFVHRTSCPSTLEERTRLVPTFARLLRQAGIDVIDTATLIHGLRGRYNLDLFPAGGGHWNMLGAAHAAELVVEETNRKRSRARLPKFSYSYEVVNRLTGTDSEFIDVMNIMFPHLVYPTAKVTFVPAVNCAGHEATRLRVAVVGSSFMHSLARGLIEAACLWQLSVYFYFNHGRYGGLSYGLLDPKYQDSASVLDAEIVILEENETSIGRSGHVDRFHSFIMSQ